MKTVFRFFKILEWNHSIEVEICLNVQQRKWLEKSLHTLKTDFIIMTVAEDLKIMANDFKLPSVVGLQSGSGIANTSAGKCVSEN